jgi:hypothetical protein
MSGDAPPTPPVLVPFREPVRLDDPAEVALEDYARAVARAREAEAVRAAGEESPVTGMRLAGVVSPPTPQMQSDIEDFARDLALRGEGSGLGWS